VFRTCFNHTDKLNVSVAFKVSVTVNILYVESFEAKFVFKRFEKSQIYKAKEISVKIKWHFFFFLFRNCKFYKLMENNL